MTTVTDRLGFPLIEENQDLARITHNEAIVQLDGYVHLTILDRDLTAPPGGESDGDCYLVGTSATGDWATHDGDVALYYSGWTFKTPFEGMRAWIADENKFMVYDGAAWAEVGAGGTAHDLLSATHNDVVTASFQEGDILIVVDQGSSVYKLQRFAHPGTECKFLHTVVPGVTTPGIEWVNIGQSHLPATTVFTDVDKTVTAEHNFATGKIAIRNYAGNPNGVVTATREGEILWDATNDVLYVAEGATTAWSGITGGGGSPHDLLDGSVAQDTVARTVVLGDIIYGNATPAWQALAGNVTTTKKFLTQTGNGAISAVPSWGTLIAGDVPSLPSSIITSGSFAVARGGTGLATIAANSLLYASASDTISALAAGTEGHVLTVISGTPAWAAAAGGGTTLEALTDVGAMSEVRGDLFYRDATRWNRLAIGSANQVLRTDGTDPIWGTIANAHIDSSAAIALSKLAAGTAGQLIVGAVTTGIPTYRTVTGDVTISSTGVTAIGSAVIVNADIATAAAIAVSKLAALTASRAVVLDGSGKISAATTTATEIGYVNGVTSAIQTQLNLKLDEISATNDHFASFASSGAALADSGYTAASFATAGHDHSGVYQPVDDDLTALAGISGVNGDLILRSGGAWTRMAVGTNGYVLKVNTGVPTWEAEGGGTAHALDSATHTDVAAQSNVRGDLLVMNATPAWDALPIGTTGKFLRSDGTDPSWQTLGTGDIPDLSGTYAAASHNHDSAYISVIGSPVATDFPEMTAGGELSPSGYGPADFAAAGHDHSGVYQPVDATLTALAGVTTATDKLIYATDADTFATCTLTAFARTVLDDVDGAAVLSTIGAAAAGHNHDSAYISVIGSPVATDFPEMTAGGELSPSGYGPADFATAGHNHSGVYEPVISTLGVTHGGTGLASVATGNLLYASAENTLAVLDPGTEGYYLKMQGGVPVWATGGGGVTDHGALSGLSDDDHTIYALLAGRAGTMTLTGSNEASERLDLASTSHGTKGAVRIVAGTVFEMPEFTTGVEPGTPGTGFGRLYFKDDGDLYIKDDGGTETNLCTVGGGASALDDLSDVTIASVARGDILVRGASVFGNLAIGTVGQFLRSDGTDAGWAALGTGDIPDLSGTYSVTSHNHDSAYISVIGSPVATDFPEMTAGGELQASGYGPADFAAASHAHAAGDITSGQLGVAYGGTGLSTFTAAGALAYATGATALAALAIGTVGQQLRVNSGATAPEWADDHFVVAGTFGNGTDVITGGKFGACVPHPGTLVEVTLISLDATSGSITVDLWKDSYANAPATVADTMVGGSGTKPNITSGVKGQDTSFTSWAATTVAAGDHVIVAVDGTPASVKLVSVSLKFKKTG